MVRAFEDAIGVAAGSRGVVDPLPRRLCFDRNQRKDEERNANARPELAEDGTDRDYDRQEDRQGPRDLRAREHRLSLRP